jgi:signal transduction histidine kinase
MSMVQYRHTTLSGDVAAAAVNGSRADVLRSLRHELWNPDGALSDLRPFAPDLLSRTELLLSWLAEAVRSPVPVSGLGRRPGDRSVAGCPRPGDMVRLVSTVGETVLTRVTGEAPGGLDADVLLIVGRRLGEGMLAWLEQACELYHDQLLNRLGDNQQEERSRIGRELHDRLGHDLSVAYRGLESFEVIQEQQGRSVDERVVRSRLAVRAGLEYIRALAHDLQLSEPVQMLGPALREVADAVAVDGVVVRVAVNGDESWVPPEVLDEVFLVLREAIRNSCAHGRAANLTVHVAVAPDELHATVQDDGVGFDPPLRCGEHSSGLHSMSERVRLLGGRLSFSRPPGGGSRVKLSVPVRRGM